jgi:hypothetical protein
MLAVSGAITTTATSTGSPLLIWPLGRGAQQPDPPEPLACRLNPTSTLSLSGMIFSGPFERHPRLPLTIVEFELAWAANARSSMDWTYRERHAEAIYQFKGLFSRRRG